MKKRMLSLGAWILVAALCAPGCAPQSRLVKPAATVESPALDWKAGPRDGLQVTLRHVIVRDAPGSWVREAAWDEYVLAIANTGGEALSVQAVELSSRELQDSSHSTDRTQLEEGSGANAESLKTLGLALTVGFATMSTVTTAAFMAAGWTVVTPLAPLAILAGGVYAFGNLSRRSQDRGIIDHQLERRGLRLPVTLASGEELHASAFFPMTPAPTHLHVRYSSGSSEHEMSIHLKPLAQLHLAPGSMPPEEAQATGEVIKISGKDAEFPREASKAGFTEGRVHARMRINAKGTVTHVRILEASAAGVFDRAARHALSTWQFNPGASGRVFEAQVAFRAE